MPRTLKVEHGVLHRPGVRKPLRLLELPRWHGWRYSSEPARIARWCEQVLTIPKGHNQGEPFRLAPFQRKLLGTACESLFTAISIPAGNGKTSLMAAVALERMCRGDDYVEVDVIATNEPQAQRLVEAAHRLVECAPELHELFEFWAGRSVLEYRPTGSTLTAYPAKLSAVQGLDFTLALVDEMGYVSPDLITAMLARLGKAPDSRVIGFGTPGMGQDNMLESMRVAAHTGELPPGARFIEYAAEPGCDIHDRTQWRRANPALAAGFLRADALALEAATMPEHEFRAYHLGQPIDSSAPWLPYGAWEACVDARPPRNGTLVVLAVWGNYSREVAICGATLDGGVFFGWQAAKPSDAELAEAIHAASEQWELLELCHKPHVRLGLMAQLADQGLPVVSWPADRATAADSTAALYQAIAEQALAHDHHEVLAEQVPRLQAQIDRQGNPRLVESEADVSAALAARAAWWRARLLAEAEPTDDPVIY